MNRIDAWIENHNDNKISYFEQMENAGLRITVPLLLELPYIRSRRMVCQQPGVTVSVTENEFFERSSKNSSKAVLLAFSY